MNHKNFAQTTLAAAITDTSGTSITVTSETSFPAAPFIISIDTECLLVTNVSGTTWTVTRGYESSTAATHLNGATIYHDWSAGEADSAVHGPSSATDGHLAVFDGATGKIIKDGGAVPAAGLPTTGGTMSGDINMGNHDITYLKLLQLNGEIDDGNSGTAKVINWNAGVAHKSTLTGNVTLAFTGTTYLVPIMSSDTAPSGVCSSSLAGLPTWKLFDQNDSTYPYTGGFAYPAVNDWLQYAFPEGTTVVATAYEWKNQSSSGVTGFHIQGSNNGSDWTTLDTVTGFSGIAKTRFTIDAPGAYRYYRAVIDSETGSASINTIDLLATIADPPAPCFLTLKLVQDATGGRTVTWPATVKGSPAINKAANAISNILFYWDGTNYYVLNGLQFVSATDKILGRSTAGAGPIEEIACTAAGRALLDDANAAAQLTTLGAPLISSGTAAPTTTPGKVGDIFIDTTGAKAYIAKGTASSADWVVLN